MFGRTASDKLIWGASIDLPVDQSQRWILTAMQRHGQALVTMLWRILGNEQDVCDAYQDTFLQLAHHDLRRKPDHVKAYLFRTAGNTAITMLRRRTAERKRLSNVIARPQDTNSPLREIDSKYMQENLRHCIAKLPEHLRNVIALRDLAEMSYSQVGGIMGISPATARVYRCKAVQLLAMWMGRKEKNHDRQQKQ